MRVPWWWIGRVWVSGCGRCNEYVSWRRQKDAQAFVDIHNWRCNASAFGLHLSLRYLRWQRAGSVDYLVRLEQGIKEEDW